MLSNMGTRLCLPAPAQAYRAADDAVVQNAFASAQRQVYQLAVPKGNEPFASGRCQVLAVSKTSPQEYNPFRTRHRMNKQWKFYPPV